MKFLPAESINTSDWVAAVHEQVPGLSSRTKTLPTSSLPLQLAQTPSTALRHPPWSKGAGKRDMRVCSLCKLQALLYDILLGGKVPESEAWMVKCALSLS